MFWSHIQTPTFSTISQMNYLYNQLIAGGDIPRWADRSTARWRQNGREEMTADQIRHARISSQMVRNSVKIRRQTATTKRSSNGVVVPIESIVVVCRGSSDSIGLKSQTAATVASAAAASKHSARTSLALRSAIKYKRRRRRRRQMLPLGILVSMTRGLLMDACCLLWLTNFGESVAH